MEIWKIKDFPHSHKLYYYRGTAILKKILFFIFTKDEKRGTGDERTNMPSQQQETDRKHTQNIAQNKQAEFKQNDSFV